MLRGHNKQFGEKGEIEAVNYLQKNHYEVIERNFRTRNGEIDIIALDRSEKPITLVFIEVKTRYSQEYGDPLEAISYYKLQAMTRTAIFYQTIHPRLPTLLRLDAIAVIMDKAGNMTDLKLVKNLG